MNDYQKQFLDWLEANPTKKKGLTEWKDFSRIIDNEKTDKTRTLEINFGHAMSLGQDWQVIKDRFLEYWRTFYWWAVTEKHDGFYELSETFRELDYFVRHYQNSTEELVAEIKQLKSAKQQLENENAELKEELTIERDHSQDINDWYKRQLDGENAHKRNELWNSILELEWHGRQKDQKIKQLEEALALTEQLANLRIQEEKIEARFEAPSK